MESYHENLLYHTDVCWLSHGKALKNCHGWVMHVYFTKTSAANLLPFSVMTSQCQLYAAEQILKKTQKTKQQTQTSQTQPHSNCPSKIKSFYKQVIAFWRKFVVWRQHFENEVLPPLCDYIAKNNPSVSITKNLFLNYKNLSYLVCLKNWKVISLICLKIFQNQNSSVCWTHLLKIQKCNTFLSESALRADWHQGRWKLTS